MTATAPLAARLNTYQAERFPLARHGVLIAVFSGGEAVFGSTARGAAPEWPSVAVAVVVCLLLFLQLRIADEHKDHEDDSRWRPERPVPRGLVTLAELRAVGGAAAVAQLALTAWLEPRLLPLLLVVWAWMAAMSVEFLAPAWLKARPITYMVSHMAVMPLIAGFAVACGARGALLLSPAVAAFIGMAFFNGVVLEIARKSWAPEDERPGVETYSRLWGPRRAGAVLALAGAASTLLALAAQALIGAAPPLHVLVAAALAVLAWASATYVTTPTTATANRLESASGVFVLLIYLGVAWLPAAWRAFG